MKKNDVRIQRSEPKNHRAQSIVESMNRTLSEKLYSHQYAQEMVENEISREWVKKLPAVVQALIAQKKIRKDNIEEAALKEVKYKRPVGHDEVRLPPEVQVRYLFAPGEDEGGDRRRATDPIWSMKVYKISRIMISFNQPVLYFFFPEIGHREDLSSDRNFNLYPKILNYL